MEMKELDIQPVVTAGVSSLQEIIEFGLVGAVAVVFLIISGLLVFVILRQAKECHESTKTVVNNNTSAINNLKDSNAYALHGVQLALTELKGKIEG